MTWQVREILAPKVQCDVCGRAALSRHDRRKLLPRGWRATRVRGRHVCARCAVLLLARLVGGWGP